MAPVGRGAQGQRGLGGLSVPAKRTPQRVGASSNTITIRRADRTPTAEEIQRAGAALSALARMLAHDIDEAELAAGGAPCGRTLGITFSGKC